LRWQGQSRAGTVTAMSSTQAGRGYPIFARVWAFAMRHLQPAEVREQRTAMLAGARGVVVEVGAGSGTLFPHYPATVERVVAVEPEPYLLAEAQEAAGAAPVPVEAVHGTADALPVDDASADVVVCCLVLCTVPDQVAALAEARRVLRPGGELRYLEHVASEGLRSGLQKVADATVWPRLLGNCHTHRETERSIAAAGFRIADGRHEWVLPKWVPMPVGETAIGRAVRPAGG
jgi:ubiquinone/menaquinone biosynthesis C-methylase UbiE